MTMLLAKKEPRRRRAPQARA